MPLLLKPPCEKCSAPPPDAAAFICSYEWSFCPACANTMNNINPNCRGELVRRPRRVR